MNAPSFFNRDDFYKYCSKVLLSSKIQKCSLFPIPIKASSNPSIIALVIHPRRVYFRVTRLLLYLCNDWCPLSELFV